MALQAIKSTMQSKGSSKKRRINQVNNSSEQSKAKRVRVMNTQLAPFGGVSQVNQAPVSIGNTLRSTLPGVTTTRDVTTVRGRDFVMAIGGIGTGISTWCLSGGVPVTPAALVASVMRGYFQSHERYRIRQLQLHYISSSPTSLSGDVLLMYHENRGGPKVNHNSSNFLSYALSTANSVLGPQWNNMSVNISSNRDWVHTDIFNSEDVQHQADGEVLVYTRNTTNGNLGDSPGYLIMDYVVEFQHLMTNPRLLSLPSSLLKWFNLGLGTGVITTAPGQRVGFNSFTNSNYSLITSTTPAGDVAGNVYQVVIDQDVGFANPNGLNASTMFSTKTDDSNTLLGFPVVTGTTIYVVSGPFPVATLYPTYDAANAGRPLVWTTTFTSVSIGMNFNLSCVGSVTPNFTQSNIG